MSSTNNETNSTEATQTLITSRTKKVRFYIPISKPGAEETVEKVIRELCKRFGGATRLPAKGAYVMADGELVLEDVAIVDCFGVDRGLSDLSTIAFEIKETLGEETVAFEIMNTATAFA
jgi:hypothetical protein